MSLSIRRRRQGLELPRFQKEKDKKEKAAAAEAVVDVELHGRVLGQTNPTYASWNLDSSCNRGFHHTNFSNPNLLAAARGLRPSTLRFGGSGNDNLVYGLSPGSPECEAVEPTSDCAYVTPGCLNSTQVTWNAHTMLTMIHWKIFMCVRA